MNVRYNNGNIDYKKFNKFTCIHLNYNNICKKCQKWLDNNLESENKKIFGEL